MFCRLAVEKKSLKPAMPHRTTTDQFHNVTYTSVANHIKKAIIPDDEVTTHRLHVNCRIIECVSSLNYSIIKFRYKNSAEVLLGMQQAQGELPNPLTLSTVELTSYFGNL